ncbi:MarR family winged helix-turn-helix transcriptional regulator [Paenibacillus allorhizosphaerae]|uniref:HTH marR-type domain-containing protein n=1 Tax=Paenibacillus allorhizosphaerae TaxID=2849866 RepID=A0ABM8VQ84_9BACL|nr:MarR family transcriptional regulator [Paenibacillus allorhizosphaerae]CAG7653865.1 hypothetical protein PAECIP111802_05604 [Paenibacillus allorhizosphaerae]
MYENYDLSSLAHMHRQVMKRYEAEWSKMCPKDELTLHQSDLLLRLAEEGPLKSSDLAQQWSVSFAGMTYLSDKLVELGLIERIRGGEDRRVVMLSIMDKGRERVDTIVDYRQQLIKKTLNGIYQDDLRSMGRIYSVILNNLTAAQEPLGKE